MTELVLSPERLIRERLPSDPPCNKFKVYNLEGELFFGSAPDVERILSHIEEETRESVSVILLRVKRVRNPDAVCLRLLERFVDRMLASGKVLLLSGVRKEMHEILVRVGIVRRIGEDRIFLELPQIWSSTHDAVKWAYEYLGDDLCEHCPRRGQPGDEQGGWYYMI